MGLTSGSTKTDKKLCTIDDLCAIYHPFQSYLRLNFMDYKRVNGRFAIPSSKLLQVGLVLAAYDCIGNAIKCVAAIASGNVNLAQEIFAVFGMAVVMTSRGFSLEFNRNKLSKLYNDLDRIFPRSAFLQERMEVEKCHRYIKRRFFFFHNFMCAEVAPFCVMPLIKFLLAYDFEEKGPVPDEFHLNASWMPFGVKENLSVYPFIYAYETILALIAVNMIITWDQVFAVTMSHLCMYYQYLAKLLEEIDVREANDPQQRQAFFKQLHHYIYTNQCLNKIASDLNDIFNLSILISDMCIAASICFHLFLVSDASDYLAVATYIWPCLTEMWLLYDVAKWGTLLETVTSRINEVLYEQPWYESSLQLQKYTMMWMQGTNEPMRLTAFNIFNVNMKHFQDMMMLAYQMLTFMKSKS
ncbi:PREDICTED: odorant receptor 88a [Rhagoletis zephyria]|uniref:odorant receptor 88a n=1 Tax=Rhagoletis zephyria TaxID=28612 RepID=UPI000811980C|nr:PREDICTED: odorant receptor 88a [Rhagoletis zephyria]